MRHNNARGGKMIYLMRHGQDDETKIGGWSDGDLTLCGKKQVNLTGVYNYDLEVDKIIASDIKRCQTTAQIMQYHLRKPIIYDDRLREQNKGDLNGMDLLEANEKYFDLLSDVKITTCYPNGESLLDLYKRIERLLPWILKQDKTLIITHRGVINMLYYILKNIELDMNKTQFDVTYASVHELDPVKKIIKRRY